MKSSLHHPSRYFRGPITRGLPGTGNVDEKGGQFGAGLIRQAAIITRGEALGHDIWIDSFMLEQVANAINAAEGGVKSRFTHPGLSGDGLGKALGRVTGATVDGDAVRADVHLYETAHESPSGDLAKYVLKLAREDPGAFGTSIVFAEDRDAMKLHRVTNSKAGKFRSPDAKNTKNLSHVRLAELQAVDVVDSPAANPDGLFHRGVPLELEQAEAVLPYLFNLTNVKPAGEFDIDLDRIKGFLARWLSRNSLRVLKAGRAASDLHLVRRSGR